ncbi:MAG: hypothetical protein LUD72_05755, partial [Bacteroidales bacterium]|nr:hypothetical protein [Bacteroidales bacterium]
ALHTVGYQEIFAWLDYIDNQTFANDNQTDANDKKTCANFTEPVTTNATEPVTSLDRAVELIQRNTRHYARRQLSYFHRDPSIRWLTL